MKTRRSQSRSKWFWYVIAALVGVLVGVVADQRLNPLTPDACTVRMAQLGAPPQYIDFVCQGRQPH